MSRICGLLTLLFGLLACAPQPKAPITFSPSQTRVYLDVLRTEAAAHVEFCHCDWEYDALLDYLQRCEDLLSRWDEINTHPVFRQWMRETVPFLQRLTGERSHSVRLALALAEDTTVAVYAP